MGGRIVLPDGTLQEAGSHRLERRDVPRLRPRARPLRPRFHVPARRGLLLRGLPAHAAAPVRAHGRLRRALRPRLLRGDGLLRPPARGGAARGLRPGRRHRAPGVRQQRRVARRPWRSSSATSPSSAPGTPPGSARSCPRRRRTRSRRATAPRPDAKRILVLEDRLPKPELGSGYPRSNRIIAELVAAGADVTFFPMFRHRETWADVRRVLDPAVQVMLHAAADQLRPFLQSRRGVFDAILVCRPHNMQALLDAVGGDRDLLDGVQVIYDAEAVFARRTLLEARAGRRSRAGRGGARPGRGGDGADPRGGRRALRLPGRAAGVPGSRRAQRAAPRLCAGGGAHAGHLRRAGRLRLPRRRATTTTRRTRTRCAGSPARCCRSCGAGSVARRCN